MSGSVDESIWWPPRWPEGHEKAFIWTSSDKFEVGGDAYLIQWIKINHVATRVGGKPSEKFVLWKVDHSDANKGSQVLHAEDLLSLRGQLLDYFQVTPGGNDDA